MYTEWPRKDALSQKVRLVWFMNCNFSGIFLFYFKHYSVQGFRNTVYFTEATEGRIDPPTPLQSPSNFGQISFPNDKDIAEYVKAQ
jgi:hypothetical protein